MPTARTNRSIRGRRALAALIGVLALLAQALLPAAALAATAAGATQIEFCTTEGRQVVAVGEDGAPVAPFAGLPCPDCVGALTAALAPPAPAVAPVAYTGTATFTAPTRQRVRPAIRAPPRPPSRAPPHRTI
ncbi:DUF2946 family protein [Phenylobacterium sp.]|jgi:hypothetical protein|uniref:DUF2946 family protein n=1 Tax=Phenylobacterium sp. TaxID=1871053 RepID=UPI002E32651F|nr:DUF2946 family protein [Phenylobacterium sp.]HEX2559605.1 DUF2946 family protein [Phenylobacterium sp.]